MSPAARDLVAVLAALDDVPETRHERAIAALSGLVSDAIEAGGAAALLKPFDGAGLTAEGSAGSLLLGILSHYESDSMRLRALRPAALAGADVCATRHLRARQLGVGDLDTECPNCGAGACV